MEAKLKAAELVEKFAKTIGSNCEHDSYCDKAECHKLKYGAVPPDTDYAFCSVDYDKAKQCALIAVKEQIKLIDDIHVKFSLDYSISMHTLVELKRESESLREVKSEIELL